MKNIFRIKTVVLIIIILFVGFYYINSNNNTEDTVTEENEETKEVTELQIEDIQLGTGQEAQAGDVLSVHYTGTLLDGTKFDSSVDRGQPFQFQLGAEQVIQGWEEGFAGMRVGGTRRLVIPPHLAYGATERPGLPANSTLIFDVELLEIIQ